MVGEIIDDTEKIEKLFDSIKPYCDKVKNGCIFTLEKATVVLYKTGNKNK